MSGPYFTARLPAAEAFIAFQRATAAQASARLPGLTCWRPGQLRSPVAHIFFAAFTAVAMAWLILFVFWAVVWAWVFLSDAPARWITERDLELAARIDALELDGASGG